MLPKSLVKILLETLIVFLESFLLSRRWSNHINASVHFAIFSLIVLWILIVGRLVPNQCLSHLGIHIVAPLKVHQDVSMAVLHFSMAHRTEEVLSVNLMEYHIKTILPK